MKTKSISTPLFIPVPTGLLQRKCACGGTAGLTGECAECHRNRLLGGRLQTKLRINQHGDRYEQEADRVAEQVMRMPDVEAGSVFPSKEGIQRKCAACENGGKTCPKCAEEEEKIQLKPLASQIAPLVQRQAASEEEIEDEEEENIQAKETPGNTPAVTPQTAANINALKGGGQPLPEATRRFFEPRFGMDFSRVRVHTGLRANETAKQINARAFTIGQNIVLGAGQYAPESIPGKKILAHELTHVVQQGKARENDKVHRKADGEKKTTVVSKKKLTLDVVGAELAKSNRNVRAAAKSLGVENDLIVESLEDMINQIERRIGKDHCVKALKIWNHGRPGQQRVAGGEDKIRPKIGRPYKLDWSGFNLDWLLNSANQKNLNRLRNSFCCDSTMHWLGCATVGITAKGGIRSEKMREKSEFRYGKRDYSEVYQDPKDVARHGASLLLATFGEINAQSWANSLCTNIRAATEFTISDPNSPQTNYKRILYSGGKWVPIAPEAKQGHCACDPVSGKIAGKAPSSLELQKEQERLRGEILRRHKVSEFDIWWDRKVTSLKYWQKRDQDETMKKFMEIFRRLAKQISLPAPLKKMDEKKIKPFLYGVGIYQAFTDPRLALCYPDNYWQWLGFPLDIIQQTPEYTRSIILHELLHAADIMRSLNEFQRIEGPPPKRIASIADRCKPTETGVDRTESKWSDSWGQYVVKFEEFEASHEPKIRHLEIFAEQQQQDFDRWTHAEKIQWLTAVLDSLPIKVPKHVPLAVEEPINRLFRSGPTAIRELILSKFKEKLDDIWFDFRFHRINDGNIGKIADIVNTIDVTESVRSYFMDRFLRIKDKDINASVFKYYLDSLEVEDKKLGELRIHEIMRETMQRKPTDLKERCGRLYTQLTHFKPIVEKMGSNVYIWEKYKFECGPQN